MVVQPRNQHSVALIHESRTRRGNAAMTVVSSMRSALLIVSTGHVGHDTQCHAAAAGRSRYSNCITVCVCVCARTSPTAKLSGHSPTHTRTHDEALKH
jgi:hypothetical protein